MGTPTRLAIAAAAVLLTACATKYKPASAWNQGGYGEQLQAPGIYQVWFRGNHHTTEYQSDDLAMLRAAEVCLGDGKPFMRTSNYESRREVGVVTPGFTVMKSVPVVPTSGNPPSPVPTVVGNIPGNAHYDTWSGLKVECLAEKSENAKEATAVAALIREQYRLAAK